ncbi:MAG: hypothetical protein Phog2KO_13720 [Phototrophicaceae bacterium]
MVYRLAIICFLLLLTACTSRGDAGRSAQDIIPNLSEDYISPDVSGIYDAFVNTGVSAAALSGQPLLAQQIAVIESLTECMTERTGAVAMKFYVNRDFPTVAGMALVINRDRLLSIENILGCLDPRNHLVSETSFNPCLEAWEYREDGVTYYIMYAGTAQLACDDLANALPKNT